MQVQPYLIYPTLSNKQGCRSTLTLSTQPYPTSKNEGAALPYLSNRIQQAGMQVQPYLIYPTLSNKQGCRRSLILSTQPYPTSQDAGAALS
jgi:hypothetical protein